MTLTTERVLALAPDDASAKAARGLTAPAKWPLLGAQGQVAWGECQGSGSKPYQTQADLAGPVFRCSCPSRKFPCKHGLALLLIRAQSPDLFTADEPPAWVAEWLASRAEKAQKKEERQQEKAAAPADPLAAAKREAKRWDRIDTAAAELQRWMADQIAQGLAAAQGGALAAWDTMAARMVDAQAPGLGQRLREAAACAGRGSGAARQALQRLGELQLITEAVRRRADLPTPLVADVRAAVGWPLDKAEVLAQGDKVSDTWTVMGVFSEERDDKLTERRTWLHGNQGGRRALLLEHAFGGRGFETAWAVGSAVAAQLAYFPGRQALRAVLVDRAADASAPALPSTRVAQEWEAMARQRAACPWAPLQSLCLPEARLLLQGESTVLVADGRAWPAALPDNDTWALLACTGGHAHTAFGEWDGQVFRPASAWSNACQLLWQRGLA